MGGDFFKCSSCEGNYWASGVPNVSFIFFKKIELFLFSDLLNQSLLEKHVEITACYLYLKQHLEAPAGGWCLLRLVAAHSQPSSHPGPCTNEPKMAAMAELPAGGAPGSSEMAVLA